MSDINELVRAELTNTFPDQAAGIAQSMANALAGVQPPGIPVVALPGFWGPSVVASSALRSSSWN
ncbi:MAG: hypothetical protein V3S39_02155 [Thermodesulfobacteriota bacterium]